MKEIAILLAVASLVVVAGCSTMAVNSDYDREADFGKYRSYQWLARSGNTPVSPLTDKRIRTAVDGEMAAKGYRKSDDGKPDLWIAYKAFVRNRVDVSTYTYGYWGPDRGGAYVDVDRYKEGTLVLDVVDPEKSQLVWRGWARGVVGRRSDPEARIKEAVHKIMERFPPK